MEIEFKCGAVAKNVGMLGMALNAHMASCTDKECIKDCEASKKKYC